jgi:hypothetical protein
MKKTTVVHSGEHAIEFYWQHCPQCFVNSLEIMADEMLRDMVRGNKEISRKFLRAIDCNLAN